MINPVQERNLRGTLIILLLLTGVTAIGAGYSFMADPSGKTVGVPLWYLQYSGFPDFLIPGIILFVAVGLFGVLSAYATVRRWKKYPATVLFYGLVLIGWISIQVILVRDFNVLHLLCLCIGLGLIVAAAQLSGKK